jgi:hypothetical protein
LGHVAQAEREHRRNVPGQDLWGERFSSGKLRCHVGECEENMTQVLSGRSGTQEGIELSPQPLAIEIEEPAALGRAILRAAQPQPLESLDDGVEVGGARGSDRNVNQLQPSLYGDGKVQVPETHERARGPSSGMVGHP